MNPFTDETTQNSFFKDLFGRSTEPLQDRYSHRCHEEHASALEVLPDLSRSQPEGTGEKTGTDDEPTVQNSASYSAEKVAFPHGARQAFAQ